MNIKADERLDAKGLACPMPLVKAKKALGNLQEGQVIEVLATDKGSTADLKAWSKSAGHQYLGTLEEGDVLMHYLRKTSEAEAKGEAAHKQVTDLEDLQNKVDGGEQLSIIDVREPAEFAFGHIPGAVNIPLGDIENRLQELNKDDELHIICRSGSRSDLACQVLSEKGFSHVNNVLPGMAEWKGSTQSSQQ